MAVALVNSVEAHAVSDPTTASTDMTGVDFIVALVSRYTGGPGYTFGDSEVNSYTQLTEATNAAGFVGCALFYAWNPTVTNSMIFGNSGTNVFSTVIVAGFSGVKISADPFLEEDKVDDYSTFVGADLDIPGLSTVGGNLLIFGAGEYFGDSTNSWTPATGTTIAQFHSSGVTEGGYLGYHIPAGVGTIGEALTPSVSSANGCGVIAEFEAAAGGGGGAAKSPLVNTSKLIIPKLLRGRLVR